LCSSPGKSGHELETPREYTSKRGMGKRNCEELQTETGLITVASEFMGSRPRLRLRNLTIETWQEQYTRGGIYDVEREDSSIGGLRLRSAWPAEKSGRGGSGD
jgi:hypothetical protein